MPEPRDAAPFHPALCRCDAQIKRFGPTATLHLTISRSRAPGVRPEVYRVAGERR